VNKEIDERAMRIAWKVAFMQAPSGVKRAVRAGQLKKPHGVKRQHVPWNKAEEIRTPYFIKALKRRRARSKAAKQSRKRNR
jgi:hypothetical protein